MTIILYFTYLSVKHFYMMGGNMEGLGNITATAEFNFFADPESAHVVIDKLGKIGGPVKTTIVTYELCKRNFYSWVIHSLKGSKKTFFKNRSEILSSFNVTFKFFKRNFILG